MDHSYVQQHGGKKQQNPPLNNIYTMILFIARLKSVKRKTELWVRDIHIRGKAVKKSKEVITENVSVVVLPERGRGLSEDIWGCSWSAGNVLFLDLDEG